jgi:putative ABC transport system substrate-binding protein
MSRMSIHRREILGLLGGAAAWPIAARAQQPTRLPTIGFLGSNTPAAQLPWTTAFVQRLQQLGWIDGRNVRIEYRWADANAERAAEIAAEFARLKVDVIFTSGSANIAAVKRATSLIPIVFAAAADPIGTGLIASLARPGGNATGLATQQVDIIGKRLELLREVIPGLRRLGIMANVGAPGAMLDMREVQTVAHTLGLEVTTLEVRGAEDIAPGLEAMAGRVDALYVATDPFITTHRLRINILALSARLPTMHGIREQVEAAGLMSYGTNFPDLFRRAGDYVDKILRGAKPADLPVEQPVRFDLVVNLIVARALGLTIPPMLLARADEVIE